VPAFLIASEYDFIITPEQLKRLNSKFQNSKYYIVPNGGHICFIDNPSDYFTPLIKFIKSNSD